MCLNIAGKSALFLRRLMDQETYRNDPCRYFPRLELTEPTLFPRKGSPEIPGAYPETACHRIPPYRALNQKTCLSFGGIY